MSLLFTTTSKATSRSLLSSAASPSSSSSSSSSSPSRSAPSLVRAYYRPVTIHSPFAPPKVNYRRGKPGVEKTPEQERRVLNKGDILAPGQLSRAQNLPEPNFRAPKTILGPKNSEAILIDPFHRLKIDPRFEYKNARLLSSFVSEIGRIKGRAETGLTRETMRKLGKGIKRSMAMGLMHRWQNKDPFAPGTVPWSTEKQARRMGGPGSGMPLQSRLSAMGQTGGVGMGKIVGFSRSVEGGQQQGGAGAIEAPKGSGVFGLVEGAEVKK